MFAFTSLVPVHIISMERFISALLFLIWTGIVIIWFFRKDLMLVFIQTKPYKAFMLISVSLIFHFFTIIIILLFADQPAWPFESNNNSFLLMNNFYIWVKPFDVLMQHLLIVLMVLRLHSYRLTLRTITSISVGGFGLIHIFRIFLSDIYIGITVTAVAIIFALLFPYMILKVRNGYIYNFMLHLGIYNIASLIAWFMF